MFESVNFQSELFDGAEPATYCAPGEWMGRNMSMPLSEGEEDERTQEKVRFVIFGGLSVDGDDSAGLSTRDGMS